MVQKTAIRMPKQLLEAADKMKVMIRERTGVTYSRSQVLIRLIELGLDRVSDVEALKHFKDSKTP